MAAIVLSTVMDAIASTAIAQGVTTRAYAYPAPNPIAPCMIVGYPRITFDYTFKRGADEATFPIWFVVGKVIDKSARDQLSLIITGATGVKDKLDGDLTGAVQTCRVEGGDIEVVNIAGVEWLAFKFTLDVIT